MLKVSEEHINTVKIISLKSILTLLVSFVLLKAKESIRIDLHITITISMNFGLNVSIIKIL